MISLVGKVAIVTGGSRGIGAACARLLASAGAKVAIGYRSRDEEAQRLATEITSLGGSVLLQRGSLDTLAANEGLVQATREQFGQVDIFVGNAGVWPPNPLAIEALPADRWRHTMATNVDGMYFGAQAVIPHLPAGGRMIFISSTAGQRGEAGHADYAASKGAMISFVKSLAVELGPRDITVNSIAPGWVDTEAVTIPFADEGRTRIEANIPLRRVASPDDIAGPVLFLASPLARHVTGEILNVNGGSVLCG
ncbi:MAG TPA: glucose 1-dehydrogenase [Gemmatimonas sp.]|uniref:SDR family NAD(P)-dependent oxidoreductase n=1 Tax=Gemmatimonas sp. TaxID=1962908 RepID=UPI002ED90561